MSIAVPRVTTTPNANIAVRLAEVAAQRADQKAVIMPCSRRRHRYRYRSITFAELEADSTKIAAGLRQLGVVPGKRIVLMVRPSIDFVSLTFALFKAGAVTVLIDPGMGKDSLLDCLQSVAPDGFVAIPLAQAARVLHRKRFPHAQLNVTVGRRWFWGGLTLAQLRRQPTPAFESFVAEEDDEAAIIFTSGSTGPPKGVLFSHGNFGAQVEQIRDRYAIQPGGVDLACFPLFGLFNSAMGTTTVIPDMDASRPARADPEKLIAAINDHQVTQSFASPAVWTSVGRHCQQHDISLSTLRRVMSAGAPVPAHVLQRMKQVMASDGECYTPYGATEALPIASISASEVLSETAAATENGQGTCVGKRFVNVDWQVIRISDGPIATIDDAQPLPVGEIGELITRAPQVTRRYVTRTEANALHKIADGSTVWHRMGDVGYLDALDRFWFCGRKAHRLETPEGPMYTIPCEAILNRVPAVYRSALVGLGPRGQQQPVMICEPWPEHYPFTDAAQQLLLAELIRAAAAHPLTARIRPEHILLHGSLPVDVRHNAKIFREALTDWASQRLGY